jgi:hypothetical protein
MPIHTLLRRSLYEYSDKSRRHSAGYQGFVSLENSLCSILNHLRIFSTIDNIFSP